MLSLVHCRLNMAFEVYKMIQLVLKTEKINATIRQCLLAWMFSYRHSLLPLS